VVRPADPVYNFLSTLAYVVTFLKHAINYTGNQNLLAYAEGEYLDRLAELYGVERLPAKPAITTLRFSIEEPLPFDVVIPAGTRVTPDGELFFRTTQEVQIPSGQTYADVQAECKTPGVIGNGFLPGQINQLVDPIPYVTKVENVTTSIGGSDAESDDRFRERIRLSLERFSTAGPKLAYEYWTKTAHQDISDVSVYSPQPGVVKVHFLVKDGALPTQDQIELVQNFLNQDKVRPLTDQVVVEPPQVVNFGIKLTYYIHRKDSTLVSQIQQKVQKAVEDFVSWTGSKIGRDILPEELIRRVKEAGAYRVDVQSPVYTPVDQSQVAKAQNITVNYGGLVDD
jgi:phage-related baseplate assembly protein